MGISSYRLPSTSYATQTGTLSRLDSTSSLVMKKSVTPLTRAAYRATTASNQPVRRGRPVVTPYSPPVLRRYSPCSSRSSVGNGPEPTRVVYALTMPITLVIRVGPRPAPTQAPPAVGDDEVTNGYVPWSTSSMVACAPSSRTFWLLSSALARTRLVSATYGFSRSP